MDRSSLMSVLAPLSNWFGWQSKTSTRGAAASGITLGDIAGLSAAEALLRLASTVDGLTTEEANARLKSVGPNEVAHEAQQTMAGEIIRRSINPLNLRSSTRRRWLFAQSLQPITRNLHGKLLGRTMQPLVYCQFHV
jgi:hypothetical protein